MGRSKFDPENDTVISESAVSDEDRKDRLLSSLEGSLVEKFDFNSYVSLISGRHFRLRVIRSIGRCQSLKGAEFWNEMTVEELELLCEGLCQNKVMESLTIGNSWSLGDEGAIIICKMLAKNQTLNTLACGLQMSLLLEQVHMSRCWLAIQLLKPSSYAVPLCRKRSWQAMLRPLTASKEGQQANTSLTALSLNAKLYNRWLEGGPLLH